MFFLRWWLEHTPLQHLPPTLCLVGATDVYSGFGDVACRKCLPGYYRLDNLCQKCPKAAYMLIVMIILMIGASKATTPWVMWAADLPVLWCP